jgi:hypothetical protein
MKFCLQLQNLSTSYVWTYNVPSSLVKQRNDSIVLFNDILKYYFALYFEIIKLLCGSTYLQNVTIENLSKEKMSLQMNCIRYPTQNFIFKFIENAFEPKLPNI